MLRLTKRTVTLPIIGYSLATFYLVGFIFYLKYLHFPIFLDTVLIGIPFIGRMLTPILYPLSVIKYGMEKILYLSLAIMGIISILEEFSDSLIILIIFRFITGVLYGLSTSSAIEMASMTKIRLLIGLTMGGWSIGWIFSALSAFFLSNLMLFTGLISIPFILYPTRRHGINLISTPVNSISTHISKKINIDFSVKAFIIFF
ncbi:hypothetical protein [Acidianus brierleyi]|uniref:Major facilitator superfamily (MFS) profile domain-containing protein n=1 Tax=Acidianus brierleyi TaxID=41673 RepID=A0A2U9IBB3_9CREN|nr:hypothetical protein [Acidianus brierleyi]AWR93302.1 hypothetical protein DFR85_00445 [Acidianus brierleyi]